MLAPSILPPTRFFPAPSTPFDTEVAVVSASNVARLDEVDRRVIYVSAEDAPDTPRYALVRGRPDPDAATRIIERLRARNERASLPSQRIVIVEDADVANAMAGALADAGLVRTDLVFRGARASELATRKSRELELQPLVGDDAWRAWSEVEREILAEAIAPAQLSDALLDRSVSFKRRQQREATPIRRFLARDTAGEAVGMIGYAPFAACDLGMGEKGPLVRLRDVAVVARHRRRGYGLSLLGAVAERAIEECGATQVLICGARDGAPGALYARASAKPLGTCTMWSGELPAIPFKR